MDVRVTSVETIGERISFIVKKHTGEEFHGVACNYQGDITIYWNGKVVGKRKLEAIIADRLLGDEPREGRVYHIDDKEHGSLDIEE